MSMKQLKKSGALQLPKETQKCRFDLFKPMHEMWEGYMKQLIKATGKNQLAQSLISADFHGAQSVLLRLLLVENHQRPPAHMTCPLENLASLPLVLSLVVVAECKIESFTGAHGITVRETSYPGHGYPDLIETFFRLELSDPKPRPGTLKDNQAG
ncbi:PREDICTED: uncharacterized protein LOC104798683 [Tarenaya hassleriana]|uniref:uncharacterized protein LOC104798683 n=1 Tax=Tarenaya hassleriana TaxID=28532 RepID=UPI00053C822C|nr:PREDICTED: uncharacterized protein LOC104798683 [Tarenaya hassleriana]